MTLNGVMAVTLRYFTEFGKPTFRCIFSTVNTVISLCLVTKSIDLWQIYARVIIFCSICVRCRRKESSCSLSHLLMSFLDCSDTAGTVGRSPHSHHGSLFKGSHFILLVTDIIGYWCRRQSNSYTMLPGAGHSWDIA